MAGEQPVRARSRVGASRQWRASCLPSRPLGHASVETTMIYTHVVKELRTQARSPLDILQQRTGP